MKMAWLVIFGGTSFDRDQFGDTGNSWRGFLLIFNAAYEVRRRKLPLATAMVTLRREGYRGSILLLTSGRACIIVFCVFCPMMPH